MYINKIIKENSSLVLYKIYKIIKANKETNFWDKSDVYKTKNRNKF